MQRSVTRREAIKRVGLAGAGAVLGACGSDDDGAVLDVPASCVLTPQQIEGPFFIDTGLLRRDITEGKPGVPLTVRLQLVDVDTGCEPIRDALIEVWHSDGEGVYSGFEVGDGNVADAPGETFLRGYQMTDRSGRIAIETIYPGWYPVRTIHIHVMALIDGVEQVTTQLYFDQDVNDRVTGEAPYDTRGPQQIRNEEDFASGGAIGDLLFDLEARGRGYVASYVIGIARPR